MTNTSKPTPTTNADIKALVDRYMAGETSNEEEATLRSWFRHTGDNVPEEWLPLRAMFAFIDGERDLLSTQGGDTTAPHDACYIQPAMRHDRRALLLRAMRRPRLWISSAVAAAAVALAMLVPRMGGTEPQSYAVIDGKVYTNPEVVHEQAMDALNAVSADAEDPFGALDMMQ